MITGRYFAVTAAFALFINCLTAQTPQVAGFSSRGVSQAPSTAYSPVGQTNLPQSPALDPTITDAIKNSAKADASADDTAFEENESLILTETPPDNVPSPSPIFGKDIFTSRNLTFAPSFDIATPKGYVLSAGDEVIIDVWGEAEMNIRRKVSKEGTINIPRVGPIFLNGLTIEEAAGRISSKMSSVVAGVGSGSQVTLSLGSIRSIKVNITGEVSIPGTYTLPSLATLFNAIYAAGGVNEIGSLRSIKVYRNSKLISTLDVYDYLINGRYETNIRLEDNDMIIIQPYDRYVKISGKVKRERIYELKDGENLDKLIEYSGGFRGDAYTKNILVTRKSGVSYSVITAEEADYPSTAMKDGDEVEVGGIAATFSNSLSISGAVWRPGIYEYSDKLNRLSALIAKAENLKGDEFLPRGEISRTKRDMTREIIPFNVAKIADGTEDVTLLPGDAVYIASVNDLREGYAINVFGEVNNPGILEYQDNMTVEDAVLLSGGFTESASLARVEVSRRIKDPKSTSHSDKAAEVFSFDISATLDIAAAGSGFVLKPFDEIYIRRSPGYKTQQRIDINGEVLFSGSYAIIENGERLSDLISRSGGLTPEAYAKGASLTRLLTDEERLKLETLAEISRNSGGGKDSLSIEKINFSERYRIGISLDDALKNPGGRSDIILRSGDIVSVPREPQVVRVSGSVLYHNAVVYENKSVKDYISQAGGYSDNARRRPFVVYMNGRVSSTRNCLFFKIYPRVEPGSDVVVPTKEMKNNKMSAGDIISLGLNATTTAAMITSLLK